MINIQISENIKENCSGFAGAAIFAQVANSVHQEGLWKQIDDEILRYKATHELDDVKKILLYWLHVRHISDWAKILIVTVHPRKHCVAA